MKHRAELVRCQLNPADWRVERIIDSGEVEVAIFSGHDAYKRAAAFRDDYYAPAGTVAAPVLLDACNVALGHLTGGLDGDWRDCDPAKLLRAAIAAATGGETS